MLAEGSRAVLKGEQAVRLRESVSAPATAKARRDKPAPKVSAAPASLDEGGQARFAALKAWRAEVARKHGVSPFVIFHDATLAAMAERCPRTLDELVSISGIGVKKLDKYGNAVLQICNDAKSTFQEAVSQFQN